jgi:hypothetical protein
VPALGLLAACGSDSTGDSLQTADTTGAPAPDATVDPPAEPVETSPTTEVPSQPVTTEPVLSYTMPGGFTTREFAFQDPPSVLITNDGTLIGPSVTTSVYPGPLLPQHQTQTVSPVGIEALLAAADAAGLFADVDYTSDDGLLIADAATSVLTISADGSTYTHEAYALGVAGGPGAEATESTPERQALLDFITALRDDPASLVGVENLGSPADYEPDAYQLIAAPIEDLSGFDPAPTVQPWPADTGVDLATATECVEVEREVIGDLFADATQLTFFEQDGETYQVTPRPAYPGRTC